MRVLLVEDTPRLAEAVAEILRKGGYGADVAHTAPTAWIWPPPAPTMWFSSISCCPT